MASEYQAIDGQCPDCNSHDVHEHYSTDKIYCKGCDSLFINPEFYGEEGSAPSGTANGNCQGDGPASLNRD